MKVEDILNNERFHCSKLRNLKKKKDKGNAADMKMKWGDLTSQDTEKNNIPCPSAFFQIKISHARKFSHTASTLPIRYFINCG